MAATPQEHCASCAHSESGQQRPTKRKKNFSGTAVYFHAEKEPVYAKMYTLSFINDPPQQPPPLLLGPRRNVYDYGIGVLPIIEVARS